MELIQSSSRDWVATAIISIFLTTVFQGLGYTKENSDSRANAVLERQTECSVAIDTLDRRAISDNSPANDSRSPDRVTALSRHRSGVPSEFDRPHHPIMGIGGQEEMGNDWFAPLCKQLSVLFKDEGDVVTAESKGVREGDVHHLRSALIGDVVEIAFRIGILEVDRRRNAISSDS